MELTRLPPPDLQALTRQYTDRTEGVHLSSILHDILCTMDPERYNDREGGPNWMNFLAGLMLETALEQAWLDRTLKAGYRPELIRPGEVLHRRIICTPDAYDTLKGQPEEYKCTKRSMGKDIDAEIKSSPKFWNYWQQLKFQACATGSDGGALWVLFINGNYNRSGVLPDGRPDPDSGYVIRGWDAKFSGQEKMETETMIVNHANRLGWL